MARPPQKSKEDKVRIVLAVLRGEVTIAEAARRESTSETSVAKWRDQFLAGREQSLEERPATARPGGNRPWPPRSSN